MADKSFGVKELNLLNASGTPTVTSPNNLNLNANTVAISTSATVGNNLTVTSTTTSANVNVTGIATVVNFNATGISTIVQPADSNPMANWTITNNSASAYRFTGPGQSGTEDNPNIYLVRGHRYIFRHNATSSHPIQIRFASGGSAYTDGVTYSDTGNNRTTDGNNLIFNVQHDAPAQLFYQCTAHGGMVGNIYIVGGPQVISGVVTATTFVGNLTGNPTGSGANLTNLPAANLTGTLPAISGANLTSLPSQVTITSNADNRIITGGSGTNLVGESALTYSGNVFKNEVSDSSGLTAHILVNNSESSAGVSLLGSGSSFSSGGWAPVTDAGIIRSSAGAANGLVLQAASGNLLFYTDTTEKVRITSGGYVNIGGSSTQTTHLLHLQSTGDAGIHIRADSDNSGENDNPYLSMSQDGSTAQELKIGQNGDAGQNFALSLANSPFIHANHSAAYPLQLAHMDTMCVFISSRHNELGLNNYSGNTTAGMEIQNRGNDTATAIKLTGHNNTGTPGAETFTQLTHIGSNLTFEIMHVNDRAFHIGSTRRIRVPGVWGVNGSSMRTVQIESDGNLCAPSSIREAKINIESISDVSWLYNFNPVTFNFRTKTEVNGENVWGDEADDGGLQYGLIADEVEAVNQDLCFYDDGKLSGVHYDRMMSPLIKAVQDQKKEIDALKAKVAALEGSGYNKKTLKL